MKKPVKSRAFCKISGCRGDAVHSGGHCDTHLRALRKKRIKRRQQHTYFSPRHRRRRLFGAKKAPNPPSKMRGSRRTLQRREQERQITCDGRDALGWLQLRVGKRTTFSIPPEFEMKLKIWLLSVSADVNDLLRAITPPGVLTVRVPGVKFPIVFGDWVNKKKDLS